MIKLNRPQCPYPKALQDENYKHQHNKEALRQSNSDKCMYCESKISHIDYAEIEHIKPKEKYPEMKYTWDNLGYACSKCNNAKSDKYDEHTNYIDPYSEYPETHIYAIGAVLFPKHGSERGEITLRDIQLNRPQLLERRQEKIERIAKAITACFRTQNESIKQSALKEILQEAGADKEYSFVIKTSIQAAQIV